MTRPPPISARSDVSSFIVMDMLRLANGIEREGGSVIHMEVGQPSYAAPKMVLDAAAAALAGNRLGYTEALGIEPLRARIARHYGEAHGLDISPARVIVTTGSSGAFILGFLAAFDVGARVGLTRPGYPAYRNILRGLGLHPVDIEIGPENRWAPRPEDIEALCEIDGEKAGLDGVLLASPANPTGTMLSPDRLAAIAGLCRQRGLWFISDEIYHRLEYEGQSRSALEFSDDAIIINSFSKYYCMTGWRIGWMVVPDRLVRPIERLAQNFFISAPAVSQYAALVAFDATEELDRRKAVYARNRAMILKALPEAGITEFTPPDGAFYVYADVGGFTNDAQGLAETLLKEAHIATTPGADFAPVEGNRFLRLSFPVSNEEMVDGLERLKIHFRKLQAGASGDSSK